MFKNLLSILWLLGIYQPSWFYGIEKVPKEQRFAVKVEIYINTISYKGLHKGVANSAMKAAIEDIKQEINNGASVNITPYVGESLLHGAAANGDLDFVTYLVEHGAKINATASNASVPLYGAVSYNHMPIVKYLVEKGALVNSGADDILARVCLGGRNEIVNAAVRNGNWEMFSFLIEKGANIHQLDNFDETLLFDAVSSQGKDALKIVNCLLDQGININSKDRLFGQTVLHKLAYSKNFEMLTLLINRGIDAKAKDKDGKTALSYFIKHNSPAQFIEFLQKYDNPILDQVDNDGNTALHLALNRERAESNYINYTPLDKIKYLIQQKVTVNAQNNEGKTALHYAASSNYDQAVNLLLEKGACIDTPTKIGWTALHYACLENREKIVDTLLKNGANVNAQAITGLTPLHLAACSNCNIVKKLMQAGAKQQPCSSNASIGFSYPNNVYEAESYSNPYFIQGDTPLHSAAQNCRDIEVIKYLITHGASVHIQNAAGMSPLHYACESDTNIVAYLLQQGAKVQDKDRAGKSAIHYAYTYKKTLSLLLKYHANINERDNEGNTALFYFTNWYMESHDKEALCYLIEQGIDINAQNNKGNTVLHIAESYDCMDLLKELYKFPFNTSLKNKKGETAHDYNYHVRKD